LRPFQEQQKNFIDNVETHAAGDHKIEAMLPELTKLHSRNMCAAMIYST